MKLLFKISLLVLVYVSILGWIWQDSLAVKNKEGNKLYREGNFDQALAKWRDAQIENPEKEELHYNIGNALHEQKKYEDAFSEYEKSLDSKDAELQARSYYNIGNTNYRMGKLAEAIDAYKKCLDITPNDQDAKYNIEFIRKKMKENKQTQAQQEKKSEVEQQKESESQGSEENKEKKEEKRSSGEEKQAAKEENKEEKQAKEEKAEKESTEKKEEMSKEDAIRLLDALKDDEKDLQKELRKQPIEGEYRVDKDW